MPVTSEAYRDILRYFPAGVTIVTIKCGEEIHGLTVSAFASVSPEPPLIMVVIDHQHSAHTLLERPEAVFAVKILRQSQVELSNRFAWIRDEDRFEAGNWTVATTGAPILADALGWLDCTIYSRHTAGSHTIYIGEVQATATVEPEEAPLIYWNRGYRHLRLKAAR
jgi:flavin reductase (DIM6/NTAB) family NADH-FMN oxidoreductase RutF